MIELRATSATVTRIVLDWAPCKRCGVGLRYERHVGWRERDGRPHFCRGAV